MYSLRNNLIQNFEEREKIYLSSLSHRCYYGVDGIGATPSSTSVKETLAASSTM